MRWSKFITFYEERDSMILFNSVTRGVNKIKKEYLDQIDCCVKGKFRGTISDEMKDVISELYIDEYIVPDNYSEKEIFSAARYNRDKENKLVMYFVPTFNCNFRCPYCIVSSTEHGCTEAKNIISDEDTVKAAKWVVDYIHKNALKSVIVELFGGEPLLGHRQNLLFLEMLGTLKEEGIALEFNMISNCYTLSDRRLRELKQVGLNAIQCTIDGPKEIHDKRRILANGNGSFDRILENIERCRAFGVRVTIRINIDAENAPYITQLINELAARGLNDFVTIGIAPVDPPINDAHITGHTEKVMGYVSGIFQSLRAHRFNFKMWETFCGNGTRNFFVLGPDGGLYNCPSYAGMEGHCVGNIHDGGFDKDRPGMHEIPEKCYSCSLVGICSGGCNFIRSEHNLGEEYCLKSTHSAMVNGYISARYKGAWKEP